MAVISEVEIYKQFGSMLDKPGLRLKQVKEYMREVMESIMRESGSVCLRVSGEPVRWRVSVSPYLRGTLSCRAEVHDPGGGAGRTFGGIYRDPAVGRENG